MSSVQSPVLALLRRLEAQNIWRMGSVSYSAPAFAPQQGLATMAMPQLQEALMPHHAGKPHTSTTHHHHQTHSLPHLVLYCRPPRAAVVADNSHEWYEDSSLTAQDALKLLVNRIREKGPVKQRHLQHLYQRCQSPDELEKALRLTRLNYLARGELQQHDPFSHRTSAVLLHEAMRLGAPELAQRVLLRSGEFGLPGANARHFNQLLIYHSKQTSLRAMLETYELMKRAGPRPDSETCFILVKGCVDGGRADLARMVIQEFEAAGVRVRAGTKLYIEQHT